MSQLRPCEACGGGELWVVPAVKERGYFGWEQLGWADGLDPISAEVCCACHHVAWRATPRPETKGTPITDVECRDCLGRSHTMVATMHERTINPGRTTQTELAPEGASLSTVACNDCGRLEWRVQPTVYAGEPCEGECRRCRSAALRIIRPVREENGKPLPVAVLLRIGRGELELRWCNHCGASDWRAHGVAKLAAERKQIVDARERVPVAGGPYR